MRGDEGFGDSSAVWRARLFLFVGFALMAGGLAGSVVCPTVPVCALLLTPLPITGLTRAQIRHGRISGPVPVLRLRERRTERVVDALRSSPLDRPKREQRVRVQSFDLSLFALSILLRRNKLCIVL